MIIIDICITVRVCVDVLFNSNKSSFITLCAHEHTLTHTLSQFVYVIITYANELNSNMRNI